MNHKMNSGVYHNDYSPRYKPAYDIYEKARLHMKKQRKLNDSQNDQDAEEDKNKRE